MNFIVIYCIETYGFKRGKGRKARGEKTITRHYARNKKVAEKIKDRQRKHYYPGQLLTTIRKVEKTEWQSIRPEWVEG